MLADRWKVPPWVVDEVPWYEIANELDLMGIEQRVAEFRKKRGG